MKIQHVNIKKFKCVEDLDTNVNGSHILLMGDNGVGKSSVIQFIEIAFGKTTNIPVNFEADGYVITDKDGKEFTFKVSSKEGKPVVTITSPEGLRDNRKGTLAGIIGAIDFDIDEFVELSKTKAGQKKQVEIFKAFLPEEIRKDLVIWERNIACNMEDRTELNRKLKETDGAIKSHPLFKVDLSTIKAIDVQAVSDELNVIRAKNKKHDEVKMRQAARKTELERLAAGLAKIKEEIRQLEQTHLETGQMFTEALKWLNDNPILDTGAHEQIILKASETNLRANQKGEYTALCDKHTKLTEESGELTALIDSTRQAIKSAVEGMAEDGPIPGLVYDDEVLLYKGIPVSPDSMSTSEIMELGYLMKIAENKDLGILFLQRCESLGRDKFKALFDMADKLGVQIVGEQVERGTEELRIELIAHK